MEFEGASKFKTYVTICEELSDRPNKDFYKTAEAFPFENLA